MILRMLVPALLLLVPLIGFAQKDSTGKDTIVHVLPKMEQDVLERIERISARKNFIGRIIDSYFSFDGDDEGEGADADEDPFEVAQDPYRPYENRPIGEVNLKVLDPFGESITDPEGEPDNILERLGNFIHVPSWPGQVRDYFLFEEGDLLNPLMLSETERLLRTNLAVYDAEVFVQERPFSDTVDVLVLVQDRWNYSANGRYRPLSKSGSLSLSDNNFVGLGHRLGLGYSFSGNAPFEQWNLNGSYLVPNIASTFLSTYASFSLSTLGSSYSFRLNRPFYAPTVKWAGGAGMSLINFQMYTLKDSVIQLTPLQSSLQDVWLARALDREKLTKSWEFQKVIALRYWRVRFPKHPPLTPEMVFNLRERDNVFASFSLTSRQFFQDRYIFSFGRTEDVPVGRMLAMIGGIELSPIGNRPYAGVQAGTSSYNSSTGYFSYGLEAGTYFTPSRLEESVMAGQFMYFTNLLPIWSWNTRHYLWARGVFGYNRYPDQVLELDDEEGIRGLYASAIEGRHKLVMNYEFNAFPPWRVLGFQMAGVLFIDLAWLGKSENPLTHKQLYQGYGIGVRFKNEHLVFSTLQLMFGVYPNLGGVADPFQFFTTHKTFYEFPDFYYSQPGHVSYD